MQTTIQNHLAAFAKIIGTFLLLTFSHFTLAQDLPRASPHEEIKQLIGLTDVKITYGRPGVKGRKGKIWGELVPYGAVWRTGANEASIIEFFDSVKVNGKTLLAGKYALYTIPQKDKNWVVIFNKNTTSWGANDYNAKDDVLRINCKAEKSEFTETMTFEYANVSTYNATILLRWENLKIGFDLDVFTMQKAIANIDEALRMSKEENWQILVRSANFYKENKLDLQSALQWALKAVRLHPEHYYPHWVRGEILAKLGDYNGGIASLEKALSLGKNDSEFIYEKTLRNLIKEWDSQSQK